MSKLIKSRSGGKIMSAEKEKSDNPNGRPTKYDIKYNKQVFKLCLLGATDKEIADFWGVCEKTINNWKKNEKEFLLSLKKGKEAADAKVAKRLYQRAIGYDHKDLFITQYQGKIIKEGIIKHNPPDVTAQIFWLKNRRPDLWRDKQEHDLTLKGKQIEAINYIVPNGDNAKSDN